MKTLYVISMAVAFTNMFNGKLTPFYIKYIVAAMWGMLWLYDVGIKHKRIEKKSANALREYCIPFVYIMIWSLIVWCIDRPALFSSEYVTRMLSNTLYILLTFISAVAGVHFFGKAVIKLSAMAMCLSVFTNLVFVVSRYGISTFLSYLPNALNTTDYAFKSTMYNFALALEVQDITMATGFYLIFFIFFDADDSKKTRVRYICLMFLCAYIGFKRTTLVGLFLSVGAIWLAKRKKGDFRTVVYTIGAGFIVLATLYVVLVKLGFMEILTAMFDIDANGRVSIYRTLASYYEVSLFYLGKGFLYVDKAMYDSIGFAAHSVIIKMFAEIGCIPYFIWLYHYIINVPLQTLKREGNQAGKVAFVTTLYLFSTYFMENTMALFCIQYSFLLIPLAINAPKKRETKIRFMFKW